MQNQPALPVHPTKRHPHTGEPIRAIWVAPNGRVFWPIMGGSGDGTGDGSGAGAGDGTGNNGTGTGDGTGSGNATDEHGKDLGYPKDTRVAEMTAEQRAAYWKHQSQKHEGRYKSIAGDRSFDDIRKDLDELAEIRKSQQTPAEQALAEAREAGKAEAIKESSSKAATAIFRVALQAQGHDEKDIDDLVENFNVANFIGEDGDVDTDKLSTFAKRFTPAGKADDKRRRDFGGGHRPGSGQKTRGAAGKAEAERRFKKTTTDA